MSLSVKDDLCPFGVVFFPNFRPGATKRSFPAAFNSPCVHQVVSAPASHRTDAGPSSHQCASECGERENRFSAADREAELIHPSLFF